MHRSLSVEEDIDAQKDTHTHTHTHTQCGNTQTKSRLQVNRAQHNDADLQLIVNGCDGVSVATSRQAKHTGMERK